MECHGCKQDDKQVQLSKCPICFRYFCEEHCYLMSGRRFCSAACADYFFFSDPDD